MKPCCVTRQDYRSPTPRSTSGRPTGHSQTHYLGDESHLASLVGLAKEPLRGPREEEEADRAKVSSFRPLFPKELHVEIRRGL